METDKDLLVKILVKIVFEVEKYEPKILNSREIIIDNYDELDIALHIHWLNESGYIKAWDNRLMGSIENLPRFLIGAITEKGKQFLDDHRE